jgi:hypothetical protein
MLHCWNFHLPATLMQLRPELLRSAVSFLRSLRIFRTAMQDSVPKEPILDLELQASAFVLTFSDFNSTLEEVFDVESPGRMLCHLEKGCDVLHDSNKEQLLVD